MHMSRFDIVLVPGIFAGPSAHCRTLSGKVGIGGYAFANDTGASSPREYTEQRAVPKDPKDNLRRRQFGVNTLAPRSRLSVTLVAALAASFPMAGASTPVRLPLPLVACLPSSWFISRYVL